MNISSLEVIQIFTVERMPRNISLTLQKVIPTTSNNLIRPKSSSSQQMPPTTIDLKGPQNSLLLHDLQVQIFSPKIGGFSSEYMVSVLHLLHYLESELSDEFCAFLSP